MRSRVPLFALLLIAGSLALPVVAHAGGIPFFGPIIPDEVNRCAAGWGLLMVVINNIISLLITLAIVFVAPLMIAWSGFLFVVNPVNAEGKGQAKKILTNTVVGIVIALAGWLIVNAIMVALYNPDTPIAGGKLGVWSQLVTSGGAPLCIPLAGSLKPAVTPPPIVGVVPTVTVNINSGVVVSTSAVNVLKDILGKAGLTSATITSGRRTSDDQTRVMYDNLQTSGVASQKALYGPSGDAVIDVYFAQKQAGAGETMIKAAMKQKIDQLGCSNVSNHCSTSDVFDVAPSSISNDSAFRTAVQNSAAVKKYIFPPTDPAYHIEL
jgi:hypothetical protein